MLILLLELYSTGQGEILTSAQQLAPGQWIVQVHSLYPLKASVVERLFVINLGLYNAKQKIQTQQKSAVTDQQNGIVEWNKEGWNNI